MLLNNGITGFSDDKALLPIMSCDEFKRICYEIATSLKFNMENFYFKLEGKNFYSDKVKINNDTIFILLSAYYCICIKNQFIKF